MRSLTSIRRTATASVAIVLAVGASACTDLPEDVTGVDDPSTDPCASSTSISIGQSMRGEIGTGDCAVYPEVLSDRWEVSISGEMTLQIDVTSPAFDAFIELRDASGQVIGYGDDYGPTNARIIQTVYPGTYTILVARIPGQVGTGEYHLTVAEGPDCSSVGDLSLGQAVFGEVREDDCYFPDWGFYLDNWTLDLTARTRIRAQLKSDDFDETLLVRDEHGGVYWIADTFGPTGSAQLEVMLDPGEWTFSASAPPHQAFGSYELLVEVAPPCTPGTTIVLDQMEVGEITTDDCLFDGWAPADSFALELTTETSIELQMKSPDFDPFALIRDQSGYDVAAAWVHGPGGTATTHASLPAGTYSVLAISHGYPPQGSYQLTISEVVCEAPETIPYGEMRSGQLDATDCLRAGGAYKDIWEFELDQENTVQIDLTSASFDTWLELYDAAGALIETDDDGGSGLNSRIDRTLSAGSYRVIASSYAPNQTGSYQLYVGNQLPPQSSALGARISPSIKASLDDGIQARLDNVRARVLLLRGGARN